jgi:hypothetical protein
MSPWSCDITFYDGYAKMVGKSRQLKRSALRLVPGRAEVAQVGLIIGTGKAFRLSTNHRNMTAIYSNSTPIQPGSSDPNADLDASQRRFDVYEAYQHALADEEVSPCAPGLDMTHVLI